MTHVREVVGLNSSTVYWMDTYFRIDLLLKLFVCLERPKINGKEAEVSPFLKK